MIKVLIADDNQQILSILTEYVRREGYFPITARDGMEALELFQTKKPDVALLDVMMPELDGFRVCRKIREMSNIPVILLTVRGEEFEKIMGLDIGADDYIVKPFSPAEVMARIRTTLRRIKIVDSAGNQAGIFRYDNLEITPDSYHVAIDGKTISLTKKEFELLWTLANSPDKVFSRDSLLNSLWGYGYAGDGRTVDSHIKRLRSKLEGVKHPAWDIKTVWGVGYKFMTVAEPADA